jgi:uncharacterized repeat protein (TIGR01451 family)
VWVTNLGTSPAMNVTLNDGPSSELSFVSASAPCVGGFPCDVGTLDAAAAGATGAFGLAAGSSVSLSVVYQVGLTAVAISNTANVSGAGLSVTAVVASPPLNIPVLPRDPDAFGKTAPISGSLAVVDEVPLSWATAVMAESYRVCVGTAADLCDVADTTVTSPTTSYAAHLATPGTYWWQVTALGATGPGTPADGGMAWTITRETVVQALIGTRKTPSTQDIMFGELLTYTIAVSNAALTPITVTVTDTLQGQAVFQSATAGYVLTGQTLEWTGVTVPAGGMTTLEVTVIPMPPPGLQTNFVVNNTAVVSAGGVSIEATAAPVTVRRLYQVRFVVVRR